MNAAEFMALVFCPEVYLPEGAKIHEAYLHKSKQDGFSYAPVRNNERKLKPNILPFGLLSPVVRASNVGPFKSAWGWVTEQVSSKMSLQDLLELCKKQLDSSGNVPDPGLGERTWKVWCEYARQSEPNHPNLVATYEKLDEGTRNYDFYLNGVALQVLVQLVEAQIEKERVDSAPTGS